MPVNINGSTGVSAVQSGVTLSNPIFTGANTANGVFSGTSSFTGNVAVSGANSYININGSNVSPFTGMMKNRIINGDMRIDQRFAGASNTVPTSINNFYVLDRFFHGNYSGTGTYSVRQMNGANSSVSNYESGSVPSTGGFINSMKLTVGTANTSTASDGFTGIYQAIEGLNTADLSWGTSAAKSITVSFWVKSSITGQFSSAIWNSSATQTYPMSFTISQSNTWQFVSFVVPGSTTGTWPTNNNAGLNFAIFPSLGSAFLTSSTGWTSNLYGLTGQTNWMATSGNTFYVTGIQIEVGTQATPFEFRQYGTELSLCQRYYYQIGGTNAYDIFSSGAIGSVNGTYYGGGIVYYPVTMRATPTIANTGSWASTYVTYNTFAAVSPSPYSAWITHTGSYSGTHGAYAVTLYANNDLNARLKFTAEL